MIVATELRDDERELFERELDDFVPGRVFDAHAHLHDRDHFGPDSICKGRQGGCPERTHLVDYRRQMALLLPGRRVDGLLIPGAVDGDPAVVNPFIAEQIRDEPRCRGAMLVGPDMAPDHVRQEAQRLGMAGLKCYHVMAGRSSEAGESRPTWDLDIPDYLPEPLVQVADELGLSITLHMVKRRALADPRNQQTIRHYCETYPNMRMILAHAARGFNPHHTIEGIGALAGLRNVWCDCSAVADCGAMEAIIETLGHERLLYGSDYRVSHFRGRCVAIGDSFLWIYEDTVDWSDSAYANVQPVLVGLESLRCLKLACRSTRLTDTQVEDVFYNNAARLFGLD